MMFYDVLWCSMMFYDVLCCSMMFYDVLWCSMMFYDVLWCSMMFYDALLWCSVRWLGKKYWQCLFTTSLCLISYISEHKNLRGSSHQLQGHFAHHKILTQGHFGSPAKTLTTTVDARSHTFQGEYLQNLDRSDRYTWTFQRKFWEWRADSRYLGSPRSSNRMINILQSVKHLKCLYSKFQ